MELNFIGRGSAFNPEEGTNSAYIIEGNSLFLIDCGETTFERLIIYNLLKDINEVYIMITHTHSDHIGSLGTLVSYLYYKKDIISKIVIPNKVKKKKYLNYIEKLLQVTSCSGKYRFIIERELDNKHNSFKTVRFKETIHSDSLDCYGLLFDTEKGYIYYSGDTNELNNVKELINNNCVIDKIYLDTTISNNDNHLNIKTINSELSSNVKNKVYCMHLDDKGTIKKIKELGFKVVEVRK